MDIVLVTFVGTLIFGGWRAGFLKSLAGLIFTILSFVLGAYIRYPVGAVASTFFKSIPANYANLVGYAIAFPALLAGLHVASRVTLGRIRIQGVTRAVDAALGAIFGAVEAILILSVAVVILDTYFGKGSALADLVPNGTVKDLVKAFNASTTVHLLRDTTVPVILAVLGPLLPTDVKTLIPTGLPGGLPTSSGGVLPKP